MQANARRLIAALLVVLGGCAVAPQQPIALDPSFWEDRRGVIGVAADKMPEAITERVGPQGLLDMAVNQGMAEPLIEHLKGLNYARAAAISNNFADALTRRGLKVEKLPTIDTSALPEFKAADSPQLYAARDFRGMAGRGFDRLLVVSVEKIGTTRQYYGFVPLSPPRALFAVKGQLIDLKTNRLIWHERRETTAAIAEPWDQAPAFPNVRAAVLKNLADGAEQIERALLGASAASAAAPAVGTPVLGLGTAGLEERLKELKRLHDAGLIETEVYVQQQRRILESAPPAPAPSQEQAAAQEARPARSPQADAALPRIGQTWEYSVRDQKYRSEHRFSARVRALNGSTVDELITFEGKPGFAALSDTRQFRFAARTLEERYLVEMSPYFTIDHAGAAPQLLDTPADYPTGIAGGKFSLRLEGVSQEDMGLRFGNFRTVRIDISGERSGRDHGAMMGHLWNPHYVSRFRYTVWYAPRLARYVKARHQQWNPNGLLTGDEVVELLEHRSE